MKQRKLYSIEVDCVPTAFAISLTCKLSGLSSCFSMKRRTLCAGGGRHDVPFFFSILHSR